MTSDETLLQDILTAYNLEDARHRLLGSRWNRVYRVEPASGSVYSLRLCPPVIRDVKPLEQELTWLERIAGRHEVRVPRPVRNSDGDLVTRIPDAHGKRLGCLFEWVDGTPAGESLTAPVLQGMGEATARLHQLAREWRGDYSRQDFRPGYHYESSLAISHRTWIREREKEIGKEDTALLLQAVDWLVDELERIGETDRDFGIIHADLHPGNFLVRNDEVSVIDFDQLGWGHYAYDIAVLMVELMDEPETFDERWDAYKGGYEQVAPLPFKTRSEIDPFVVAVNLAFLDWVFNADNPEVREQMSRRVPSTIDAIRIHIDRGNG